MAPVAGGIADRQKYGLVAALRFGQSFGSPGPPIDWIVFVLEQIRARLFGETVAAPGAIRLR
jgi:hypothetical protein